MESQAPEPIPIVWEATPIAISPDGLVNAHCLLCQCALDIHQPDEQDPVQLLGTCGRCRAWYIIRVKPKRKVAMMFGLPSVAAPGTRPAASKRKKWAKPKRRSGPGREAVDERGASGRVA